MEFVVSEARFGFASFRLPAPPDRIASAACALPDISSTSCCAHSDVVKASFRVSKVTNGDEWNLIPRDIIHGGESAPDRQPTLFAIGNLPTCFFPGEGGL